MKILISKLSKFLEKYKFWIGIMIAFFTAIMIRLFNEEAHESNDLYTILSILGIICVSLIVKFPNSSSNPNIFYGIKH